MKKQISFLNKDFEIATTKISIPLGSSYQTELFRTLVYRILRDILWVVGGRIEPKSATFLCMMNNLKRKLRKQFLFKTVSNCIN